MMKYIYGLDLSMSCTGISIFSNDARPIFVTSVDTKSGVTHQKKLKLIAEKLLELKEKYPPETIVIEKGFYRFAASTEAIFKVHGLAQYLFWDIEQVLYAPTTIKKLVGGKGNMTKEEIRCIVSKRFPEITFMNNDESDSVSVALCFFQKRLDGDLSWP